MVFNYLRNRFVSPCFVHQTTTPWADHARPYTAKSSRSKLHLIGTMIRVWYQTKAQKVWTIIDPVWITLEFRPTIIARYLVTLCSMDIPWQIPWRNLTERGQLSIWNIRRISYPKNSWVWRIFRHQSPVIFGCRVVSTTLSRGFCLLKPDFSKQKTSKQLKSSYFLLVIFILFLD